MAHLLASSMGGIRAAGDLVATDGAQEDEDHGSQEVRGRQAARHARSTSPTRTSCATCARSSTSAWSPACRASPRAWRPRSASPSFSTSRSTRWSSSRRRPGCTSNADSLQASRLGGGRREAGEARAAAARWRPRRPFVGPGVLPLCGAVRRACYRRAAVGRAHAQTWASQSSKSGCAALSQNRPMRFMPYS